MAKIKQSKKANKHAKNRTDSLSVTSFSMNCTTQYANCHIQHSKTAQILSHYSFNTVFQQWIFSVKITPILNS